MKLRLYLLALVLVVTAAQPQAQAQEDESMITVKALMTVTPTESPLTTEQTKILQNTTMGKLRAGFPAYEKRINIFIGNMRRTYMTLDSDNVKFIEELRKYEDQLPKNWTKRVTQRFRETCHCDGHITSPCPERCMDSCHFCTNYGCSFTENNCTTFRDTIRSCWCYEGSSTRCDNGNIDNCYEWKTSEEPAQEPCAEFAPNRTIIETSYLRFSGLLMEPFKKLMRNLDFQLAHLKTFVTPLDLLNSFILLNCGDQSENPCNSEAKVLWSKKLASLKELQRNITLEMVKTLDQAEEASRNLNTLKEKTIDHMTQTIRNYTSCLKGLSFTGTDFGCNPTPTESIIVTTSPPTTEAEHTEPSPAMTAVQCRAVGRFFCKNLRCIPKIYRCDDEDDCGDGSDEANCADGNDDDDDDDDDEWN